MDIDAWNEALAAWFLNEGGHRPVYLASTAGELQRMNDELGLGVSDIEEDLRIAVTRGTYHYGGRRHGEWLRSRPQVPPPWLIFLAASVLVVERQTDAGSTEFYNAFSSFLGIPRRLTQREYEESFFVWWGWLAVWLEEIHGGQRGFPTWRGIPKDGPRSVIGHPYTQVMLRREDRKDLDAFLADFSAEHRDLPELTDRREAGLHLVAALRRWSSSHRMLTTRLRSIIESGSDSSIESLAYMLLDRLFDQASENHERSARRIAVVPVFDELDRELQLAAITPSWVSPERPLQLDACSSMMDGPGEPSFLRQMPTDEILKDGFIREIPPDLTLTAPGRNIHALARRDWDLWCGVRTVENGEDVYILAKAGLDRRLQLSAIRRPVHNMPPGWTLYGPAQFSPDLERRADVALMAKERRLVPKLRGGAVLDMHRNYLVGGEPIAELPGVGEWVQVDGESQKVTYEELVLNDLGLGAGEHLIEAGPFQIPFATVVAARVPEVVPTLGRTPNGQVVDLSSQDMGLLGGAMSTLSEHRRGPTRLSPVVNEITLLGVPGEIATVRPRRAAWADRLELAHAAIEMAARSTYPGGERLIGFPTWLAWRGPDGWTVAQWDTATTSIGARPCRSVNFGGWRTAVELIGSNPSVFRFEDDALQSAMQMLGAWRNYIAMEPLG